MEKTGETGDRELDPSVLNPASLQHSQINHLHGRALVPLKRPSIDVYPAHVQRRLLSMPVLLALGPSGALHIQSALQLPTLVPLLGHGGMETEQEVMVGERVGVKWAQVALSRSLLRAEQPAVSPREQSL